MEINSRQHFCLQIIWLYFSKCAALTSETGVGFTAFAGYPGAAWSSFSRRWWTEHSTHVECVLLPLKENRVFIVNINIKRRSKDDASLWVTSDCISHKTHNSKQRSTKVLKYLEATVTTKFKRLKKNHRLIDRPWWWIQTGIKLDIKPLLFTFSYCAHYCCTMLVWTASGYKIMLS